MTAMPRPKGKGKKVAYSILGKPANMRPKTQSQKEWDRKLLSSYTKGMR